VGQEQITHLREQLKHLRESGEEKFIDDRSGRTFFARARRFVLVTRRR